VAVPRADCPSCGEPMGFWSGYWRTVRTEEGKDLRVWVVRARCKACNVTHALLPAFCLTNRLNSVSTIGDTIKAVLTSPAGVRPAAAAIDVPHSTVRGWIRRFAERAESIAVRFAALAVELGGPVVVPARDASAWALEAIGAAWQAAMVLPGWLSLGRWRFVSAVCGGSLIAANTNALFIFVGKRRFMPPVP